MSPFPLHDPQCPMLGRAGVFKQTCSELTKPTPAHISLVGPRFSGKTVLLSAIANEMREESDQFHSVIYWDLGHGTPQTDGEFLDALRQKIGGAIRESHPEFFEYLRVDGAGYDELHEVIENLGKEGKRLLLIWDGFDRPLREGRLTRNLWDNLLELCRMEAIRVVTGSRRRLQELIRDEKSVTSELWQVFQPVRLGPFDENDLLAFAAALEGRAFQPGALKELMNWTGGIPPLVVWLLNRLAAAVSAGPVINQHINDAAGQSDDACDDILGRIWADCSAQMADLYLATCEGGPQDLGSTPKLERAALVEMGLATLTGGRLLRACRLMERHVSGANPESGALARLFGTWDSYRASIRGILERRIAQIARFDDRLFRMVERGIADIPDHPDDCLNNLTHIEDRALDTVWTREVGGDGQLSADVVSYWSGVHLALPERRRNKFVGEMIEADEKGQSRAWSIPRDRGIQLGLLQLLTGSHQDFNQPKAKSTSKDTYVLLNAIHSFRNRSQHSGGQPIHLGVAVSAIMLCIELLGCLAREIPDAGAQA